MKQIVYYDTEETAVIRWWTERFAPTLTARRFIYRANEMMDGKPNATAYSRMARYNVEFVRIMQSEADVLIIIQAHSPEAEWAKGQIEYSREHRTVRYTPSVERVP